MIMMTRTTMMCLYLLVLVVVVAAATTKTSTNASKGGHPQPPAPPRKPIKLTLHHWSHLYNSSYESRLRGDRRDLVPAKRRRRHQNISYGPQEDGFPLPVGAPYVDGEYLIELGIGDPPVRYHFHLDSGNLVSWLQCQPCVDCYSQNPPIYDPTQSKGFKLVRNNDPIWCPDLGSSRDGPGEHGECRYSVGYDDGTYTKGYLIQDTVTLIPDVDHGPGEPFREVPIGCSVESDHSLGGLGFDTAGNLALSRGPLSLISILGVETFSYCLVDPKDRSHTSNLILNADDPADREVSYQVQLLPMGPFWYVNLVTIAVNDVLVEIPPGALALDPSNRDTGVILDSGSDLTRFRHDVYEPLKMAFLQATEIPQVTPPRGSGYDLCFYTRDVGSTKYLYPTLTFYFGEDNPVTLLRRAYIAESVATDIDCFSIVGHGGLDSILGVDHQYGNTIFFDVDKNLVKVSEGGC